MAVGLLHALGSGGLQQGDEMGNVGMHIAVGQQAQEVHGVAFLGIGHQLLPGFGREEHAVFDALAHQLGALGVDLTAAQCVVAHLGVAHIIVAGQADGGAVGLQPGVGAGGKQMIQGGCLGDCNSVAAAAVTLADAIHNDKYNGFFHDNLPPKRMIRKIDIKIQLYFTSTLVNLQPLFYFFRSTQKNLRGNTILRYFPGSDGGYGGYGRAFAEIPGTKGNTA